VVFPLGRGQLTDLIADAVFFSGFLSLFFLLDQGFFFFLELLSPASLLQILPAPLARPSQSLSLQPLSPQKFNRGPLR